MNLKHARESFFWTQATICMTNRRIIKMSFEPEGWVISGGKKPTSRSNRSVLVILLTIRQLFMQRIFSPPEHMVTRCLILKELAGEKAELLLLISILHTTRSSVDELLKLSLLPKCFFSYKNVAYLVVHTSRKLCLQVPQPFHWRALQLMKP